MHGASGRRAWTATAACRGTGVVSPPRNRARSRLLTTGTVAHRCRTAPPNQQSVVGSLGCCCSSEATGLETIGCRAVGFAQQLRWTATVGRWQSLRLRQATHRGGLHMEPVQLAASLSEAGPGVNYADAGHRLGIADVDPAFDEVDVSRRETA